MSTPQAILTTLEDPWGAPHGGTMRSRAIAEALSTTHAVTVLTLTGEPGVRDIAPNVRVCAKSSPQLVGALKTGFAGKVKRHMLPVPTRAGVGAGLPDDIPEVVDLAVTSQLYLLPLALASGPRKLWIDHSDLLSQFARRYAQQSRFPASLTASLQAHLLERQEARAQGAADIVTAAGLDDSELLKARFAGKAAWLPTPISFEENIPARPGENTLGFLGNFKFPPNLDAYRMLIDEVLPRLPKDVTVLVGGLGSEHLPKAPNVELLGSFRSAGDFYRRVDATIAPIRVGGGMKVKVVESLGYGRPVYATRFAVVGLPPLIAGACLPIERLQDPGPIPRLSTSLVQRVRAQFAPGAFIAAVQELLA